MTLDTAAIAADDRAAAAFAARWRPPAALRDGVAACTGDGAEDAARMAALLADAGWLAAMLAGPLDMLAAAPFAQPPMRGSGNAAGRSVLMLARGEHVAVTLSIQPPEPDPVTVLASGRTVVSRGLRDGGGRVELWACAADRAGCIAADTPQDVPLIVDGTRRALRRVDQRDLAVTVSATLTPAPGAVARHYDAASGRLVRTTAAGEAGSRMRMLLALLEATGDPDRGASFAGAADDPDPSVRWAAMRGWLRSDAAAARGRLATMATGDGDRAVRDAAAATLAVLDRRMAA